MKIKKRLNIAFSALLLISDEKEYLDSISRNKLEKAIKLIKEIKQIIEKRKDHDFY